MSFLPEVKMDFMPSADKMSDDESEIQVDEIDEFNQEKDLSQEEIEEIQGQQNIEIPQAKSKRDDMNVSDIFVSEDIPPPTSASVRDTRLTKKGKPRKKRPPMTEAHKEKLKFAREKAMISRKRIAQEKKETKALENEEKELLKKQKLKRVKQLKEEVEQVVPSKPLQTNLEIVKEQTFTKKDLEEAQLQAIMNYEKIRKSRKEQKKIQQEKNKEQEALRNQIRRAVAPPQKEYKNPYSSCY